MSDFMTEKSGPFFLESPGKERITITSRIDLWNLLSGMTQQERLATTVQTGFARAPTVMREDDGDYVFQLLSMEADK